MKNLNKDLNQIELELMTEDVVRMCCSFIIQFLQALPPLSKKMKLEKKGSEASAVKIQFAPTGYDGGFGWKPERMPPHKVFVTDPAQPVQQRVLFQGDIWNSFRAYQQLGEKEWMKRVDKVVAKYSDVVNVEEQSRAKCK